MHRKFVLLIVLAVLALACANILSPWWTLHRMRAAIEDRDYKAFSSRVDFHSLQASFKSQLFANGGAKKGSASESALDAFSEGIVGTLAGPVLGLVLGAPGVMEMIKQGTPMITRAVISSAITKVPSASGTPAEWKVAYRGWDRVGFRGRDAPAEDGSFILVRSGLWSWKLAEVDLQPQGG